MDVPHQDLPPLVVDLDGTLVHTDTLVESLLTLLGRGEGLGAGMTLLRHGLAAHKQAVAALAPPPVHLLPYNEALLAWLRRQKAAGRHLVLATASDRTVARAVADHLGLFDEVIGSDGVHNLKGHAKAACLVQRFGAAGFAYAGNSRADLPVWQAAAAAVIVNAPEPVAAAARRLVPVEAEIANRPSVLRALLAAMRPHQWVKNLLVFVPVLTAQAYGQRGVWLPAVLAFAGFCATASALYIVNDLLDLAADRAHPRKRYRPFASGTAPLPAGIALSAGLLSTGLLLGWLSGALLILLAYLTTTLLYSLAFKQQPLIDVFCLAALYVLRVLGGGAATGHLLSFWLLGFSGFLFLSLALVKRVEELGSASLEGRRRIGRRGYTAEDLPILQLFGCASTFASSVVLALYVQAEATMTRYAAPGVLWAIVPLLLFWQCRLWLSTARGYMHEDPIIYAARDWVSWLVALSLVAVLVVAKYAGFLGL
jgi:4-hydroxybenzoate polyprenyltransferase/phosphoserine phosphatase